MDAWTKYETLCENISKEAILDELVQIFSTDQRTSLLPDKSLKSSDHLRLTTEMVTKLLLIKKFSLLWKKDLLRY